MRRRPLTPAALALLVKMLDGPLPMLGLSGLERRTFEALERGGWVYMGYGMGYMTDDNRRAARALVEASKTAPPVMAGRI